MATHANSTTAPAFQVLEVCRQCAAEIRDAAKTAEPGALDDADRASLLVLADLVEIRAGYKVELRPTMERAIEGAIGLLDAADGEVDLEEGHDAELDYEGEATLGAPEQYHNQTKWAAGQNEADGELEPSLGAPERRLYHSQVSWAAGSRRIDRDEGEAEPGYDLGELDVADEPHDEQEEGNAEPWLGAANNHHNQSDWAQGSVSDLERVDEDGDDLDRGEGPDDNGIADQDGANEQWSLVWGGGFV